MGSCRLRAGTRMLSSVGEMWRQDATQSVMLTNLSHEEIES